MDGYHPGCAPCRWTGCAALVGHPLPKPPSQQGRGKGRGPVDNGCKAARGSTLILWGALRWNQLSNCVGRSRCCRMERAPPGAMMVVRTMPAPPPRLVARPYRLLAGSTLVPMSALPASLLRTLS